MASCENEATNYQAIGCWSRRECLRPSIVVVESTIYSCDNFSIGSFRKDHASMPAKGGRERPKYRKVPRDPESNRAHIPHTTKIRSKVQVLAYNIQETRLPSQNTMLSPPIDSTASTWFQIWAAALSPIALVFFVFRAAGFAETEDCRFNPSLPNLALISEI